MFDLKSYLENQRQLIDIALNDYIKCFCQSERMMAPASYVIEAGGKRLRPILCLAACTAVGGQAADALPAAAALEMIHTYSLIHDDLPALDNDILRRGKPTCHVKFDEATAILTGDALLTMSFEVLSEAGREAPIADGALWLKVINLISRAAGCRGMIEGQARDLAFEGVKLNQDQLEAMHRLKTGALIKSAVQAGGLIGKGTDLHIEQLIAYAENIGLAFQVVDDLLNIKGDPSIMGKAVGTDQLHQKNTYPTLLGMDSSERYARQLVDSALKALTIFDNKADPLRAIADYVVHRNR
jgi:geranylgeranyl diphosphate synthase type II